MCISFVITNNIAKGKGGNGLLICDGKHFCQGEWKKVGIFVKFQQVLSEVVLSRTLLQLTIAHASTILVLIELFPSNITKCWNRALFFVMASATFPSCSFSGLLHDATPCGLSSDYPGQVEVLALRNCTRDISRHCELYGLKADTALDTEWKLLLARAGKSYVLSYCLT